MENFMNKGLFDPENIKKVNEMRKTWKMIYPTQESITAMFEAIREDVKNPNGFWADFKKKSND